MSKKSNIIKRTATQVRVNINANSTKTTAITLGALGLNSTNNIKGIEIHKFGTEIWQFVDYSYDIDWRATGSSGQFIILYTYNGHSSTASQNFEVDVTYAV